MVAPIDAKATFEAEGETFTLRLNFRTIALAEREGVDAFAPNDLTLTKIAVMLRCFATPEHPDMTDDDAFALVVRDQAVVTEAIQTLFGQVKRTGTATKGNAAKAGKQPA